MQDCHFFKLYREKANQRLGNSAVIYLHCQLWSRFCNFILNEKNVFQAANIFLSLRIRVVHQTIKTYGTNPPTYFYLMFFKYSRLNCTRVRVHARTRTRTHTHTEENSTNKINYQRLQIFFI
jgi:hypothetical protein